MEPNLFGKSNESKYKCRKIRNSFLNEKGIFSNGNDIKGNLYHYTDINGVHGILDSEMFRATQGEYLNDSTEIIYIEEVLQEVLQRLEKVIDIDKEEYKSAKERLNKIKNKIKNNLCEKTFILSFSKKEDAAHLFRSYAKNDGYCLGFNGEYLLKSIKNQNLRNNFIIGVWHGPVIYDKEEQVQNIVNAIQFVEGTLKKREINQSEAWRIIRSIIGIVSLFYKNVAFEDEREYRIALILTQKSKALNCIEHRVSSNLIIPYIETKFDIDSLKEIMIGPTNRVDIIEKSLKYFLDIKKFKKDFNDSEEEIKKVDSDIEIKKSRISLRY